MRSTGDISITEVSQRYIGDEIVILPVVYLRGDDRKKVWYFGLSSSEEGEWFVDQLICPYGPPDADAYRIAVAKALVKPGRVIHLMSDEYAAAKLCAALWPCNETRDLLAKLTMELA